METASGTGETRKERQGKGDSACPDTEAGAAARASGARERKDPADRRAELARLRARERALRDRQALALGRLVQACRGDTLDPAILAGAILEASGPLDETRKEALAAAGRAHFP